MPELPEVETLRRGLERSLVGRRFEWVELRLPRIVNAGSLEALVGAEVLAVRRRAKLLLVETSQAALLVHLGLAGQIVLREADGRTTASGGHPVPRFDAALPHKSTHVILGVSGGGTLFLTDIRQFGRISVLPVEAARAAIAERALGPEPLGASFTALALARALAGRTRPLKPTLLDQRLIAGIGNIYADEALWRARLSPLTPAGQLSSAEVVRLHRSIRGVLRHAVNEGVAQVLDGRALPGTRFPSVHGREGQPCPRCGRTIVKSRVGGRGTYTCPRCQPSPGALGSSAGARAAARTSDGDGVEQMVG
jgi:formamidopyrimidine-DNA glycosylase